MELLINTKRLILKPPTINDRSQLFLLMSNPNITRFLSWEPHDSIKITENLINMLIQSQKEDKGYHWCVWLEKHIIGLISLIDVKRNIRTWTINRSELSYWIAEDYQGNGYATEATNAVLRFGFEVLKFHKIIVAHAEENIESKMICKKLGFSQYAFEKDAFFKNKKWHNLVWYELFKV